MGWFIILIAGFIGAALFWERKFHYCWKILLSVCFALYIAVFQAPVIIKLFSISGFSGGLKSAAVVGGIFLIAMVVSSDSRNDGGQETVDIGANGSSSTG